MEHLDLIPSALEIIVMGSLAFEVTALYMWILGKLNITI